MTGDANHPDWAEIERALAAVLEAIHYDGGTRDKFFDRVIGAQPPGAGVAWDKGPIFEEIPAYGFLKVAIVQFANFTTIRSASERSIYTEVTMNVEQILKDTAATAQTGKTLTVALGGGTLRLPSGEIVQRNLDPVITGYNQVIDS